MFSIVVGRFLNKLFLGLNRQIISVPISFSFLFFFYFGACILY